MDLGVDTIQEELDPFVRSLPAGQLTQVSKYLQLLLRWNRALNLTSITEPKAIIVRHFGESMYLTKFVALRGMLLDVGSGAGFPGLALKIVVPELHVVLLEPVAKKRAFLKEVARECGLAGVEVRPERIEEFCRRLPHSADAVTMRAVAPSERVLRAAAECLAPGGRLYLWLTRPEAERLLAENSDFARFRWSDPVPIPLSRNRQIWCGSAV